MAQQVYLCSDAHIGPVRFINARLKSSRVNTFHINTDTEWANQCITYAPSKYREEVTSNDTQQTT